jgi:hypothetical protein
MDADLMAAAPVKAKPKGKGVGRRVLGMPLWVWIAAGAGGLLIGLYLRRKAAGTAPAQTAGDTSGDLGGGLGDAATGAGASPSDNGLGSSSVDLQGFLDASGAQQENFLGSLTDLISSMQTSANGGEGLLGDTPIPRTDPRTAIPIGTSTRKVPIIAAFGGAKTKSSGPAVVKKKQKAIFVPAKKGERAHWALPSGSWVKGPGLY